MLDSSSPITGEVLPCPETADDQRDSPWVVYILRSNSSKWVPVCRMANRNAAWQHVDQLKRLISTAWFDVVFEGPTND